MILTLNVMSFVTNVESILADKAIIISILLFRGQTLDFSTTLREGMVYLKLTPME